MARLSYSTPSKNQSHPALRSGQSIRSPSIPHPFAPRPSRQIQSFSSTSKAYRTATPSNLFSPSVAPGFSPASSSRPAGETPQQRVARLREANRRAKLAQRSSFERWLDRSRVWADKAHRTAAYGLMGATVIAGTVGGFAVIDMVMHNRRKRREYFTALKEIHDKTLEEAREAIRLGTANQAQLKFLEKEAVVEALEAADARKKAGKKGVMKRIRSLFGSAVEQPVDTVGSVPMLATGQPVMGDGMSDSGGPEASSSVVQTSAIRQPDQNSTSVQGGVLDQLAQSNSTRVTGWFSKG